jgi:polyhydroxyalkanoate synthesis regulator phasin
MDPKQIARQMIQFNKTVFDNTFDAITVLQEQTEKLIAMYMDQAPLLPEEGKKAIADWMKAYKKGREAFKTAVDENYKLQNMISAAPLETVKESKAVKVSPAKKAKKGPIAVKPFPAKKEPKAAKPSLQKKAKKATKKAPGVKRVTNVDTVVGLIHGSIEGISTAELKEKTGLAESQIWNIVNHATKAGKVNKIKRGLYGAA